MNLKLKALLLAVGLLAAMAAFVYVLIFYPGYLFILFCLGIVYALYRLILRDLEDKEKWKKK